MVDSTQATESEFVTAELVENSMTKTCVVVDPGSYEETDFGTRLTIKVNLDGKIKRYRPNKESALNLQALGKDTVDWVGKKVFFDTALRSGKKAVIATPDIPKTTEALVEDVPEGESVA